MKKSVRSVTRNRLRSSRLYSAALETLEPRTLLTATILTQFDFTGYSSVVEANVDGQPGAEVVGIKDNLVTIINQSKNTIQNFAFAVDSTVTITNPQTLTSGGQPITSTNETLQQQLANNQTSEIYATKGNFFTLLNAATLTSQTYNIGPFTSVRAVDLDGQPGLEYIFTKTGSPSITVLNPVKNTQLVFNVGMFNSFSTASLDGQTGKDLIINAGNVLTVLNPNTQVFNIFRLPTGTNLETANVPTPDTLGQLVQNVNTDLAPSQDIISFNSTGYTVTTQFGLQQSVTITPGNTVLFGPVNLDGKTGSELVAVNGTTVWIINDTLNTMRSFTFAAGTTVNLSLAPTISDDMFTSGTGGLLFGTNGTSLVLLNPTTVSTRNFTLSPWTTLLTDDFGGGFGSQILTANAGSVTILNPFNSTIKKYFVSAYTTLNMADLDGVAGDEIYLKSNSAVTVIVPRTQLLRSYNVGAFASIGLANLDAQAGNELYLYTVGGNAITVLSPRGGTFKKYVVGTYTVAPYSADLDGVAGNEILTERTGSATILTPRTQKFKTFSLSTSANISGGPVGALPGNQAIFYAPGFVTILSAVSGTFRTYTFATTNQQFTDNLGLPGLTYLITTAGTALNVRNLANGSVAPLTLSVSNPALMFDDLDGQAGDEIIFMNGQILTIVKAF